MTNFEVKNDKYRTISNGATIITNPSINELYIRYVGDTNEVGVLINQGESKSFDNAVEAKGSMSNWQTVTIDGGEIIQVQETFLTLNSKNQVISTVKGITIRVGEVNDDLIYYITRPYDKEWSGLITVISNDELKCTVDLISQEKGIAIIKVNAIAEGETSIYMSVADSISEKITNIKVLAPYPTGIEITNKEALRQMSVGDTIEPTYTILPAEASQEVIVSMENGASNVYMTSNGILLNNKMLDGTFPILRARIANGTMYDEVELGI